MMLTETYPAVYPDIEPTGVVWQPRSVSDVCAELQQHRPPGGRLVVAVDGHSGCGKTTVAAALASGIAGATVIHTDDIAWHHSFFGWHHLLIEHLLEPFHDGLLPISYTPRAWTERGRLGCIAIPAATTTVIVEGVGAAATESRRLLDAVVWVHASEQVGRDRVIARGVDSQEFIDDWMSQENAFLADQRPWEQAALWVAGDDPQSCQAGRLVSAAGPVIR